MPKTSSKMSKPRKRLKRYDCDFCSRTFCNSTEFFKHANKFHAQEVTENWYSCSDCFTYYPSESTLTNHRNQGHQQQKPTSSDRVSCAYCDTSFYNQNLYYKHANSKHLEEISVQWDLCQICQQYFPTKICLQKHSNQVHGNVMVKKTSSASRTACNFCSNSFDNQKMYYKHANSDHLTEVAQSWHFCKFCSQYFPSLIVLKKHKEQVHPQRLLNGPVACKYCPAIFSKRQVYYRHANKLHQEQLVDDGWFACLQCGALFLSQFGVNMHMLVHKTEAAPSTATTNPVKMLNRTKTEKTLPTAILNPMKPLSITISRAMKTLSTTILRPTKTIAPAISGLTKPLLPNSSPPVKKKVACDFCPNTYCDSTQYYRHANREHLDNLLLDDWEQCDVCFSYFPNGNTLSLHRMHAHAIRDKAPSSNKWNSVSRRVVNKGMTSSHDAINRIVVTEKNGNKLTNSAEFSPEIENYESRFEHNFGSPFSNEDDDEAYFDPELLCPNVEIVEEEPDVEEEDPLAI